MTTLGGKHTLFMSLCCCSPSFIITSTVPPFLLFHRVCCPTFPSVSSSYSRFFQTIIIYITNYRQKLHHKINSPSHVLHPSTFSVCYSLSLRTVRLRTTECYGVNGLSGLAHSSFFSLYIPFFSPYPLCALLRNGIQTQS